MGSSYHRRGCARWSHLRRTRGSLLASLSCLTPACCPGSTEWLFSAFFNTFQLLLGFSPFSEPSCKTTAWRVRLNNFVPRLAEALPADGGFCRIWDLSTSSPRQRGNQRGRSGFSLSQSVEGAFLEHVLPKPPLALPQSGLRAGRPDRTRWGMSMGALSPASLGRSRPPGPRSARRGW